MKGLLLALLPGLAWAQPPPITPTRFALVIGANQGEPGEVELRYAERDAARFADVLTRFGGVAEQDLVLLKGRGADRVQAAFADLGARITARRVPGADSVLFVYYSGHADAEALHLGRSRFELTRLRAQAQAAGAQVTVLVVDACRSGALTRVKGATPAESFEMRADSQDSQGMVTLTSSALGEDAQESDLLQGGVFSHHLVTGLLGAADVSQDRQVTLPEAWHYARRETLRTTSRAPFVQHPTYDLQLRGKEDLVLTRLGEGAQLGRLRLPRAGAWLLLPLDRGELVELSAQVDTEVLVVPGRYLLRLRSDEEIWEGEVDVVGDEHILIDPGQLRAVPYGRTVRKGLGSAQAAWGPLVAGEVTGPLRSGQSLGLRAGVGGRLDTSALSLELRLVYGQAEADNEVLTLGQQSLGLDATALRLFDLGPVALGLGVRLGVEGVQQRFETTGRAPDRQALVGRGGALLRLEYAPSRLFSLGLSGGLDALILPTQAGTTLDAHPFGGLGATFYVP